jgi:hypothetical protein
VGTLNHTLLVLSSTDADLRNHLLNPPACPSKPASFNLSFLPSMPIDAGSVLTLYPKR